MSEKETRFTPGPWAVERISDYNAHRQWNICGGPHGMRNVGSYQHGVRMPQEGAANASLIAAAPDLYEALNNLVATVLDYERVNNLSPAPGRKCCWDATEHAINALSKALGETP